MLGSKKMNLVQRKKAEKNLTQIKTTNSEFHVYIDSLVDHLEENELLSQADHDTLKNLSEHLVNMNYIFTQMMNQK